MCQVLGKDFEDTILCPKSHFSQENPPSGLWAVCTDSKEDVKAPKFIKHLSSINCFNLINSSLKSASGNYL